MDRSIFIQWIVFQFIETPKGILGAWRNFLLFNLNYFSVKLLLRTLFSYWHKYYWPSPRGFEPVQWFEAKAGNFISRILGAIMRLVLIAVGLVFEAFILIAGFLVLLGWLVLPFAAIYGIIFGLIKVTG